MTTKSQVLSYLSKQTGYNTLTPSKMKREFGAANPSATINDLRNDGYSIYLNTRKDRAGNKVSYYRLGTPTKRVVSAGLRAVRQRGTRVFA